MKLLHGANKIIGIPEENKPQERRVALVPSDVARLTDNGHVVYISMGAGASAGFYDTDYLDAGATVLPSPTEVYQKSDLIVKVKEPYGEQIAMLREEHTLMSYLHWPSLDETLQKSLLCLGLYAYAFESLVLPNGERPLLRPMSEIAGKLSVQVGSTHLHTWRGGSGRLLGGVLGGSRGKVVVLGAGVAGYNAAAVAAGLGASVVVFDVDTAKLEKVQSLGPNVTGMISNKHNIRSELVGANMVVGAVKLSNAAAPKVLTRSMLECLEPGSVVVDISVDEGGCFETTKPTTHEYPTYVCDGIIHYAVTNMPGAVAKTASVALSNAITPYVDVLASLRNEDVQRLPHLKALAGCCSLLGSSPGTMNKGGQPVHTSSLGPALKHI